MRERASVDFRGPAGALPHRQFQRQFPGGDGETVCDGLDKSVCQLAGPAFQSCESQHIPGACVGAFAGGYGHRAQFPAGKLQLPGKPIGNLIVMA